ncbi:FAD dependent oxidoreductase [Variovorax sp. NFACC28]|nr:FAD dependent oxidoreductase [Variovorax sp. NFACC28]SEG61066.1 FAD dependent oxidoreductase [Variovorax sp. NFACC29]SFC60946.1 FAD dependent oxidoreductase [Variovorax sp. NFACC26]SFG67916.1 FAD dependent oxidoreductase [Variovorax sp. NFACC27]
MHMNKDIGTSRVVEADVVVCGGGVAGTMAAVAAARQGASVVLVERYGFLGGNATAGAVAQFNSWQTGNGRKVVAGLADEVVERLRRYGGAREHDRFVMSTGHHMDRVEYEPEVLKLVLDDMVAEAGVQPLLHASLLDVQCEGRRVAGLRVLTKGGVLALRPAVLVDASGDMDALEQAGARFLELGSGEALQPATMMFRFGPIDFERFGALSKAELAELAARGYAQGGLARAALHSSRVPHSDDAWFNISRLAIDATDPMALGGAEIEGRRQAWKAAAFIAASVPGCGNGRLRAFGTQVGVRETRRVEGDHVLTAAELLEPVQFADAIAAGAYPIDIHPAQGGSLHYVPMDDDHAYQIPYRSLIPGALDNALGVGRGISASHEALAAIRVMTISMAVGHAAGIAAAMAAKAAGEGMGAQVRAVPVPALREALLRGGAVLA